MAKYYSNPKLSSILDAFPQFKEDLTSHKGDSKAIEQLCRDMSPAFISGVEEHSPEPQITFHTFHVLKIINEAVGEVCRQENQDRPGLRKSRYVWLKNPNNMTTKQTASLENLKVKKLNPKTMRAYHIRHTFHELWDQTSEHAEAFLKKWYFWATHSRVEPVK